MPKKQKRVYNFKNLQGSSSNPSSSPTHPKDGSSSTLHSVNERLSELRKLDVSKANQKKRELAETVNQRSVPPHLRGILGVPESAPPKPKREVRMRERLRTPGPAPPKSWLNAQSSAAAMWGSGLVLRRRSRKADADNGFDRDRTKTLLRFARACGLERDDEVERKPSGLLHLVLKNIATNWDLLDEDDYPALAEIPLRLRLRLLSYIDFYGPALDAAGLQAVLQGTENILHLDLSSLVGHRGLSLKRISRMIEKEQSPSAGDDPNLVAESWDAEDNVDLSSLSLRTSLTTSRFSHLTHLCLANPAPSGAKWRELIALSKHTPKLTHLSLAYWPRPTLTPNLATTTVTNAHGPTDISAGGSHYYSGLDNDQTEPVSLLRQLSSNLLCLEWLDLEGCTEWVGALAAAAKAPNSPVPGLQEFPDEWTPASSTALSSSIYTTTWSRLTHLMISQGWLPTKLGLSSLQTEQQQQHQQGRSISSSSSQSSSLAGWQKIPNLPDLPPEILADPPQDTVAFEKKRARIWVEAEYRLAAVRRRINAVRVAEGFPAIRIEQDWMRGGPHGDRSSRGGEVALVL